MALSRKYLIALGAAFAVYAVAMTGYKPEPPAPAALARLTGAEICRQRLTQAINFRDPESVKITSITRVRDSANGVDDHRGAVTLYSVMVNAKNGFGGYSGNKPVECWASEAEQRIVVAAPY